MLAGFRSSCGRAMPRVRTVFDIYAQRFDAAGTAQGGEFRVNTTTADSQFSPSVAMDASGEFVVVWTSNLQDGSGYGVYAQRYDANGTPAGAEFRVNTSTVDNQQFATVAMAPNGGFVVSWTTGVGSARPRVCGRGCTIPPALPSAASCRSTPTSTTTSSSPRRDERGRRLRDHVVEPAQDGSGWGVYGQRFDAFGNRIGVEFRVSTTRATTSCTATSPCLPMAASSSPGKAPSRTATSRVSTPSAMPPTAAPSVASPSSTRSPRPPRPAGRRRRRRGNFTVAWTSICRRKRPGVFASAMRG